MNEQIIQWFPGHMAKTNRKIKESLSLVDAVAEIADARVPVSSRNPELSEIISGKPRLILLNKCDIADSVSNKKWVEYYKKNGTPALLVDCKSGKGVNNFVPAVKNLLKDKIEYYNSKGMVGKALRIMVVGIPNVGKSSFINRMAKSSGAPVQDRPGVTRANQWYRINKQLDLLDTPGVLWPKFEDQTVGKHLSFTGAIKDSVVDCETIAVYLLDFLKTDYPDKLTARYKVSNPQEFEPYELLEEIGRKRGFMARGGVPDTERAANMLLDEFREGKIEKITIEKPEF